LAQGRLQALQVLMRYHFVDPSKKLGVQQY